MQPYFLPYFTYFQLINTVDVFVIYDNIKFSKRGWIQRNRYLLNGSDRLFSLSLKKGSDSLDIRNRYLSESYLQLNKKWLRKFEAVYLRAPYYKEVIPLLERCFLCKQSNLFDFILNSVHEVTTYLQISTPIVVSSQLCLDDSLKAEKRVLSICKHLEASQYINPIGGLSLYKIEHFKNVGMELSFLRQQNGTYKQFQNPFVPNLSILDVMMFNSCQEIRKMLSQFVLE